MTHFIRYIVSTFGGRIAGSEAERKAQEYFRSQLEPYCQQTKVDAFRSSLDAHFESLKLFCLAYLLLPGMFWFFPLASIITGLLLMVVFLGHFVGFRPWLDFLYPKKTSWNAHGILEPKGECRSTLVIAGHMDSVFEFRWWYRLKKTGAALTVIASVLIGFQWVGLLMAYLFPAAAIVILGGLYALSPLLAVLFFMHDKKRPVDGALDNLTGVALAMEMARTFAAQPLQHTRLRIVSFGAEEPGLKGSAAYVKQYMQELKQEGAVLINIDTIKDREKLGIITAELNTGVRYPRELISRLEESFVAQQVPYAKVPLTIGATDGASFRFQGLPALSLVGLDSKTLDPCYHTRLDTVEHLSEEALHAMKQVLEDFIRRWDEHRQTGSKP